MYLSFVVLLIGVWIFRGRLDRQLFHLIQDPTFNQSTIWFYWLGRGGRVCLDS